MKPEYPNLDKLGIKIYSNPSHIKVKELSAALSKKEMKTFHTLFGIQTCPLVDGEGGLYPWDAEAVLERMTTGKLNSSQLNWD